MKDVFYIDSSSAFVTHVERRLISAREAAAVPLVSGMVLVGLAGLARS